MPSRLKTHSGDITRLGVDVIVNAANERMLGGGGVDGAIHRAAGPQLRKACEAVSQVSPGVRCPTGQARITPGFALPARYVVHTVGPVWHGGEHGEAELLAACYRNSLELAQQHDAHSVAFPAISCGVYGYPFSQAAQIAARECANFLRQHDGMESVLLVAFDEAALAPLESAIQQRLSD